MIERGLFARLSSDGGVAALVAEATSPIRYRIHPLMIPQRANGDLTSLPCIVYTKIGANRSVRYTGTDNLVEASIQIDCYARNYMQTAELAEAVRVALIDYSGVSSGIAIKTANLTNEFAMDDPDPGLYRVLQSWSVWYVES